ncbi:MAG: energy transducer TonB [Bacteroidales bacterium]|nr:energy transducer TonB [Bacteroidales bacterium]
MKLTPDQKAGLLITVSIHLAVIVVFLIVQIGIEKQRENSFLLDFTEHEKAEEKEDRPEKEESLQESVEAQLSQLLADRGISIRNVSVNRASLKDDRGTNAEELYKEAERLARELQEGQNRQETSQEDFAAVQEQTPQKQEVQAEKANPYSGPSVLSWSLDGRRASHLPIPAYRCYGGGQVTVIITVNNQGSVINAKVDEGSSSKDGCLQEFAKRAARLSKFNISQTAPARQMGTITYAFIAQ